MFFRPDPKIFPKVEFDPAILRERLEVASYLHKGVRIVFDNEDDERRLSDRALRHGRAFPREPSTSLVEHEGSRRC